MSAPKSQNQWTKVSSGLSFSEILRSKEANANPAQKASDSTASVVVTSKPGLATACPPQTSDLVTTVVEKMTVGAGKADGQKKYSSATKDMSEHHVAVHEKPIIVSQTTTSAVDTEHADVRSKGNLCQTALPCHPIETMRDLFVENSQASIPLSPRAPTTYQQQVELIVFGSSIAIPSSTHPYIFGICEAEHVTSGKAIEMNASTVQGSHAGTKRGAYSRCSAEAEPTNIHGLPHTTTKHADVRQSVISSAVGGAGANKAPTSDMHDITNRALHELVSHTAPGMNDARVEHPSSQFLGSQPAPSALISGVPTHGAGAPSSGHLIQGHTSHHTPSSNASSNSTTPSAHATSNLPYPASNGTVYPPTSPGDIHSNRMRGPHNTSHQPTRGGHAPPHAYMPRYSPPHGAFPVHANQWPGYGYTPMGAMPPGQAPPSSAPSTSVPPGRGPGTHSQSVGGRNMFTRGAPMPPYYPTYDYGMSYGGHPSAHHMSSNGGPAVPQSNAYGMLPGPYPGPFYGHPSVSSNANNRYGAGSRYTNGTPNMHEHASNQY